MNPPAAAAEAQSDSEPPGEPDSSDGCSPYPPLLAETVRHNLRAESAYSAFTGIFMGMILFAAPVIAVSSLNASPLEITIIASAFPCGAFLGPLWAGLGRHWGMKKLVTNMASWANLPLLLMFWIDDSAWFTAVIVVSQLLHSAMRMGQSSMYRATYPRAQLGRVLGRLTFFTFLTMVPTVLLAGWISDVDRFPEAYRVLYPIAALAGLIGCRFYTRLRPLEEPPTVAENSIRSSVRNIHRVVVSDRAYMFFQLAFFLSGSAVFMSLHITLKMTHDDLGFDAFNLALWLAVVPQILLALSSLGWGHVMDRIGIVRARLVISIIMTIYLACYFLGIDIGYAWLIGLGSCLRGLAEGGGQVTWSLASVHFAPRDEDVPIYNGIHFVLNGVRGLLMPAVGTALFLVSGSWTIVAAMLVSAVSIGVIIWSLRYGLGPVPQSMPALADLPEELGELEAEAQEMALASPLPQRVASS